MKKSKFILTTFLVTLLGLVLVQSVSAAGIFDSFNKILGGGSLGDIYESHGLWIDMIIYIFLFVFVARFAFERNQAGGNFRPLSTVVGIALAVGAMAFEWESGFRLGDIGPFALAVALLVFAVVVYRLIHGLGVGGFQSAAFAYIAIYGFLATVASPLFDFMQNSNNEVMSLVGSILNLLLIFAIIGVVVALVRFVPGMFGQGTNTFGNILGGQQPQQQHAAGGAQQAAQRQQQIAGLLLRINQAQGHLGNVIGNQQLNQQQRIQQLRQLMAEIRQIGQEIRNLP